MSGVVAGLWLHVGHNLPMKSVGEARAVANHGLEGCNHARPGKKRQVVLIDEETLASFDLAPGRVKENITTRGIRIQDLQAGARIRAGEAILEITGPCEPCDQMDGIRPGLKEALWGKRGVLARVITGGFIRAGDPVHDESTL